MLSSSSDVRAVKTGQAAGSPADREWYPRAVDGRSVSALDGAFMLTCPGDDRAHLLNLVGVFILELANGRHTMSEIVTIVQGAFRLKERPESTVIGLLEQARAVGLVR
jgi:hypothetical protein